MPLLFSVLLWALHVHVLIHHTPAIACCVAAASTITQHRQRALLLAASRAVMYTPQHEHFGIVPVEAMVAGRPVIVCNSGGPTESVTSSSGFQCDPTPAAFAAAMQQLLDSGKCGQLQRGARSNAISRFAREAFAQQLNRQVLGLASS
jgi:alpha-1,3/alpha-1,6-mannosyltransferase